MNPGKKRQMGCYFRVAFYGEKFNELNGVTMIYKEKPFTKLPEIAHRLQNLYHEQVPGTVMSVYHRVSLSSAGSVMFQFLYHEQIQGASRFREGIYGES